MAMKCETKFKKNQHCSQQTHMPFIKSGPHIMTYTLTHPPFRKLIFRKLRGVLSGNVTLHTMIILVSQVNFE